MALEPSKQPESRAFFLPESVCIAIPAYDGTVPVETANQLAMSCTTMQKAGVKNVAIITERQNGLIDAVRNKLVKRFLTETTCQKLLFLDADIVFTAEDVMRILALSSKYRVIGATYPIKREDERGFFVRGFPDPVKLNEDGLIEVGGFGAGFLVIDRSVFEEMEPRTQKYRKGTEWTTRYFAIDVVNEEYMGEDLWFFHQWKKKFGGTVILDPWIDLKHVGKKYYDYKFSDLLKERL